MISSTIELMVKKEDFSKLQDVCTLTSKAIPGFQKRLQNSLKSVPDNVIKNLNMDPEVKTKLQTEKQDKTKNFEDFDTKLAEENLEEVSNILLKVCISDLFQILKWEHSIYRFYFIVFWFFN